MRKLMFATTLAASLAAIGSGESVPFNAISFENADYASIQWATNLSARADKPDPGSEDSSTYFLLTGGDSDSSIVTNVGASFTDKHSAYFAGKENYTNYKYLALDTEGGTLWRSINPLDSGNTELGLAEAVTDSIYLDTLVQFTVTEDEAPEVDSNTDKLAIWLQAGEGVTNLMVRAAIVDDGGNLTPTNFVINNASVVPGTWYRLTVKTIADVTQADGILAFQIFLDGNTTPLKSSLLSFTDEFIDLIESDYKSAIVEGSVFASLQGSNSDSLQGVGFKGTGAVDEIVWTDEDLFPAGSSGVDFTLTWDANVTAVSYTIDGTTTTIADLTTYTNVVQVAAGATVTVAATPAAWYTVSGTGDVTVDAATTVDLTTTLAATPAAAGATGLPEGVTTAAAKAWADAKNLTPAQIAACSYAEAAYLLNTDLTNEPTFEITAIEEVSGGWQITVEAKSDSTTIDLSAINGTLKVKTGATLSALASATAETASFTVGQDGKAVITITGDNKNFMKAVVE